MHGIRSFVGGALGIAASIALTALGLTGCFETPQPSCAFQCGAGGSCPDNYSCRPDNMCKLAGVADDFACPNVPTGGIDAGPDAEPADAAFHWPTTNASGLLDAQPMRKIGSKIATVF